MAKDTVEGGTEAKKNREETNRGIEKKEMKWIFHFCRNFFLT